MLLQRNILENLTIISSSGTIICVVLNYVTNISLITGVWFPLYILILFIVSVLLSFKCIQWLLRLNKPLKYDLESLVKQYPYIKYVRRYLPETRKREPYIWKEYDTNELSVISTVLERKLVSSWYVPYVSQEIGFPFACKQMLDQMIGKAFKICNNIQTKDVFIDMCTIVITHMKEYKKALKRQEKTPDSSIESLYKMSHPISQPNTKYTTADHCTNILRVLIKELLPWELWDTPHSELLVRILAKKLDVYIESTLADPVWINDKLMTYLTGEEYVESSPEEKEYNEVKVDENNTVVKQEPIVTQVVKNDDVTEQVNTVIPQEDLAKVADIVEEQALNVTPSLDIKSSPVLRQKRGRQGRNEVKIYDRIIEGSVKTWETDMDLQCISLGQDLLASLDGEITLSRLWGQDAEGEGSPERPGGKSPQPLWFGEEEGARAGGARGDVLRGDVLRGDVLRELQHSVSHAAHRIGGLQDEAAGMMEGLLDFGMAGLRRGLRLTGLSDDSQQEKSPSHRDKSERSSPEARHKYGGEVGPNPPQQREGDAAAPPLVKQQRVTSQDSAPGAAVAWGAPGSDSPEPQYEEAADLSSSIAKLRCLLRQRAHPPHRGEEVWWEAAEETRGRAHAAPQSARHVDTATLAAILESRTILGLVCYHPRTHHHITSDEYDMSLERNASPNQGSNNMQRLDKLFHRTVTGVFNSLKTAVGGEEEGGGPAPRADWTYVCASGAGEAGAGGAAARVLAARRARPAVDAALDSLHMSAAGAPPPHDTDDLEEYLAAYLGAWSAACGAAGAAAPASHVAARLATLLLAELAEEVISGWLEELGRRLRRQAFAVFEQEAAPPRAPRPLDTDALADALLQRAAVVQGVVGRGAAAEGAGAVARAVTLAPLARELAYRAADLLAARFLAAARARPPHSY